MNVAPLKAAATKIAPEIPGYPRAGKSPSQRGGDSTESDRNRKPLFRLVALRDRAFMGLRAVGGKGPRWPCRRRTSGPQD